MSFGIPLDKTESIDILKGYCGIKAQHPTGHIVFITQKEVEYYTKLGYEIILGDRAVGIKHDQDKPHMNLLLQEVPNALVEVSKALRMGELKYGRENWKKVENPEDRYLAALLRHLVAIQMGEKQDKESGLSHLAHVAVNAMFLLDYEVRSEKENS